VELAEVVVDRQRAGLAGLVLDGGDHLAGGVEELQRGQMRDARQGLEFVGECHGKISEKLQGRPKPALPHDQMRLASSAALPM
jgi:hypothetical protein